MCLCCAILTDLSLDMLIFRLYGTQLRETNTVKKKMKKYKRPALGTPLDSIQDSVSPPLDTCTRALQISCCAKASIRTHRHQFHAVSSSLSFVMSEAGKKLERALEF